MNLVEMVDLCGVMLDDLAHNKVPLRLLMHQVNAVQAYLAARVADQEMSLFEKEASLTVVEDEGTDLPADFARVADLSENDVPIEIVNARLTRFSLFYPSGFLLGFRVVMN